VRKKQAALAAAFVEGRDCVSPFMYKSNARRVETVPKLKFLKRFSVKKIYNEPPRGKRTDTVCDAVS
jgi:hypothetical protein